MFNNNSGGVFYQCNRHDAIYPLCIVCLEGRHVIWLRHPGNNLVSSTRERLFYYKSTGYIWEIRDSKVSAISKPTFDKTRSLKSRHETLSEAANLLLVLAASTSSMICTTHEARSAPDELGVFNNVTCRILHSHKGTGTR